MSNWIRIEDKLPELDEPVLVFGVCKFTGQTETAVYVRGKFTVAPTWHWDITGCASEELEIAIEVTHWMPLPEPPNE